MYKEYYKSAERLDQAVDSLKKTVEDNLRVSLFIHHPNPDLGIVIWECNSLENLMAINVGKDGNVSVAFGNKISIEEAFRQLITEEEENNASSGD